MAEGWGVTALNNTLTTLSTTYPWIQLHVGAPGAAGTTNGATETTRKQVTSWAAASAGAIASAVALTWTSIAGSQTVTKFTTWTAATAGSFGTSGSVTANPYTAGDTFSIASGALNLSGTVAT